MPDWQVQDPDSQGSVLEKSKKSLAKPPKYKVVLHNDDFTTMEFVQHVLETIFHKSPRDAEQIMLAVHHKGRGVAGIYTYEIAEAKTIKATNLARSKGYPLLLTLEEH